MSAIFLFIQKLPKNPEFFSVLIYYTFIQNVIIFKKLIPPVLSKSQKNLLLRSRI